jgi:hypothetical protein
MSSPLVAWAEAAKLKTDVRMLSESVRADAREPIPRSPSAAIRYASDFGGSVRHNQMKCLDLKTKEVPQSFAQNQ